MIRPRLAAFRFVLPFGVRSALPFALLALAAPLVLSACDAVGITPDQIRRGFVTRVSITDFPFINPTTTEGWDGGGAGETGQADLYFNILGSTGLDILNGEESSLVSADGEAGSRVFHNAGPGDVPVSFTVADFLIDALDRSLTIEIKDNDSDVLNPDDVISLSESFRLEDYIPATLPSDGVVSIPFQSADGTMEGRMSVRFTR